MKTSMEMIANGIAPKPTHGLTFPSGVLVLSTKTPMTSSHTAPMIPATPNTSDTTFASWLLSKPLPLNAKSAKNVIV